MELVTLTTASTVSYENFVEMTIFSIVTLKGLRLQCETRMLHFMQKIFRLQVEFDIKQLLAHVRLQRS